MTRTQMKMLLSYIEELARMSAGAQFINMDQGKRGPLQLQEIVKLREQILDSANDLDPLDHRPGTLGFANPPSGICPVCNQVRAHSVCYANNFENCADRKATATK